MTADTNTAHTPGPWEITTEATRLFVRPEHGAGAVCGINRDGQPDNGQTATSEAIADANARLIAAAPALLEALRQFVRVGVPGPGSQCQIAARAAIAQATGE